MRSPQNDQIHSVCLLPSCRVGAWRFKEHVSSRKYLFIVLDCKMGRFSLDLPREMKRVKNWLQRFKRSRKEYMPCTILYLLHNLKNVKSTHGGVLLLVKLHAEACNIAKGNTCPCVFFIFFKCHKSRKASDMPSFYCNIKYLW